MTFRFAPSCATALVLAAVALGGCKTPSTAVTVQSPPDTPISMSRDDWGAARPTFGMTAQTPRRITIHHTATLQDGSRTTAQKVRALQQFSQRADTLGNGRPKRAWADIPYHFYIAPDGVIAEGRNVRFEGDSNTNYDLSGHVQIVLEGNFEEETPSAAQIASLTSLAVHISSTWRISSANISGHQDQAPTLCPGKSLYSLLPEIRQSVAIMGFE